jgi:hypothetical protein
MRLALGTEGYLVPWHAVERGLDLDGARSILETAFEDPEVARELRRLSAELTFDPTADDAVVIHELARRLVAGDFVLVRFPNQEGSWAPPRAASGDATARRLSDLIVDIDLLPVSIELLDHDGVPYAGQLLSLEYPDGVEETVALDDAGRWSRDDVRGPGSCRLSFPSRLTLPDRDVRRNTRQGFRRGREDIGIARRDARSISIPRGRSTRIVVDAPVSHGTRSLPGTLFITDSSCPTAGVVHLVTLAQEAVSADASTTIGVFGHADHKGDEVHNKLLSDRRADVAFSLLSGDFDLFRRVALDEGWDVAASQSMLRAIGCNPGAVDGELGVLTRAAIREFRRNYNDGVFHRDSPRDPVYGPVPEGDELDDSTRDALLDAFHAFHAIAIEPQKFLGPGRSGCGEFNPRGKDDLQNRRVSLAIYGETAPDAEEFPCRAGDTGACEVDDLGEMRCRFYRERIGKEEQLEETLTFWDFEWLATPSGKAHLSALTSLPDGNEAEVVVQMIPGGETDDTEGTGSVPSLGRELARVPGLVRRGVIYALCDPPSDYNPFLREQWFRGPGEREGKPWQPGFQPPVFAVAAGGRWGLGAAPGHRADRIAFEEPPAEPFVVFTNDGKLRLVQTPEALRTLGARHINGVAARARK